VKGEEFLEFFKFCAGTTDMGLRAHSQVVDIFGIIQIAST
jgi:hypothetical protein